MASSLKRTTWKFTKGIVNSPLIFDKDGNKIYVIINDKKKPQTHTEYKYLFWEIDYKGQETHNAVIAFYQYLRLPVYWHETARGIHYYSFTPMNKEVWKYAIQMLRQFNDSYPPITLRVKSNKYVNEFRYFKIGGIIGNDERLDKFKFWIEHQMMGLINKHYYVVTYPMDNNDVTHEMNFEQREQAFIKQIEDSPLEEDN